jgi:hypothetical protein
MRSRGRFMRSRRRCLRYQGFGSCRHPQNGSQQPTGQKLCHACNHHQNRRTAFAANKTLSGKLGCAKLSILWDTRQEPRASRRRRPPNGQTTGFALGRHAHLV